MRTPAARVFLGSKRWRQCYGKLNRPSSLGRHPGGSAADISALSSSNQFLLSSSRRSKSSSTAMAANPTSTQTALVLGSSGILGSTVSRYLSRELGMQVFGADVVESPFNDTDWELDGFIPVPHYAHKPSVVDVTTELASGVHFLLGDHDCLDTIVCCSGGWQGDPAFGDDNNNSEHDPMEEGAKRYGEIIDNMMCMNLYPVLAAGYTAQHFMGKDGLFVAIGATAALSATPGMLGYGLSKTATHHFVQTLGASTGKSLQHKSKRNAGKQVRRHFENLDSMTIVGILPTTIDTPNNRANMPQADHSQWTPPRSIAEEIGTWILNPPLRPHSGSLVKVFHTSQGGTTFDIVR